MSDNNQIPNNPMENEVPTIETPGFEVPPQPVQFTQPEFEQPTNSQSPYGQPQYNQPQYAQQVAPKKGKKKVVGLVAALVGVAACVCVAVFAGPKIISALSNKAKGAPIDRFKNAITESSKEFNEHLITNTTPVVSNITQENVQADITFDITLGEYVTSMLPAEYSSITNLGGDMSIVSKDKNQYVDLALSTQGSQLASIEVYLDQLSNMGYVKIPELSSDLLSVPMDTELFDVYTTSRIPNVESVDPAQLAALVTEETNIFLSTIDTVTLEEDVEVNASDVTAKYDKLTTTIQGQELVDVAYDLAKRFTEDQIFSSILDQAMLTSGNSVEIDAFLEEIKNSKVDENDKLTIDLYVDSEDELVGFVLTPSSEDGTVEFGFLSAKDGKTGFELYANDATDKIFKVAGSYTDKSDVYTGKATATIYEEGIAAGSVDFTFENVSYGDEKFQGAFSVSSPQLMGATINLKLDYEKQHANIVLDVAMGASPLISATFDATVSEAGSVPTVPADAVVYDAELQSTEYMNNADLFGFLQRIQDATGIDLMSLFYSDMY